MGVPFAHAGEKYQHLVNCDLHQSACTLDLQGKNVTLEVTPRPVTAMTDLEFAVTISDGGRSVSTDPYIDLGMPGMNMGPNRVILAAIAPGTYTGKGVIVRCPSGRKIWQATVTFPDVGKVGFVFHVVY